MNAKVGGRNKIAGKGVFIRSVYSFLRTWSFALPAARYGTTVSSLWLLGTPRFISLACIVPRSAMVARQAAIHLAWIGDHLVGCACLVALAKIAKREIAKKSPKAQLTVRIVFRFPHERAKFDAGLP